MLLLCGIIYTVLLTHNVTAGRETAVHRMIPLLYKGGFRMKCLFSCANQYVKESDWKDLALVKFCLCAIGVMIGLSIPEKKKKVPFLIAAAIFTATYIPLMTKFLRIVCRKDDEDACECE